MRAQEWRDARNCRTKVAPKLVADRSAKQCLDLHIPLTSRIDQARSDPPGF